jgi:hypothetical protein
LVGSLSAGLAAGARAVEMPVRKAGLNIKDVELLRRLTR